MYRIKTLSSIDRTDRLGLASSPADRLRTAQAYHPDTWPKGRGNFTPRRHTAPNYELRRRIANQGAEIYAAHHMEAK